MFAIEKMITPKCLFLCLFFLTAPAKGHENGSRVVTVPEGTDAVLPCSLSSKPNLEHEVFDWKKDGQKEVFLYADGDEYNNGRPGQHEQFKGRVSHFPEKLKFGNASITIRNTKVADSGDYTCVFPHLQLKQQSFTVHLIVERVFKDRSGDIEGAAPKPFAGILNIMEDSALLKCQVPGAFPNPKVEWKDSDGNVLPAQEPLVSYRGDRYYVTLFITVNKTKTNNFHCVATQEEISHVTDDKIHVPYCEKTADVKSCCGIILIIGVYFAGVLSTLAVFAVVKYICKSYGQAWR